LNGDNIRLSLSSRHTPDLEINGALPQHRTNGGTASRHWALILENLQVEDISLKPSGVT
jgi:hypothetical protein